MDGSTFSNSEIEALSAPTVVKPKKAFAIAFAVFATVLAGCATGLGANSSKTSVGQIARVEEGQVVAVRAAGSEGSQQAAQALALRGGHKASAITARPAIQNINYTVRLSSGELVSIAEQGEHAISNGTPVLVQYGQQVRVIPQNASIGY